MKVTNKKFAQEFLQMTKEIFSETSEIDSKAPTTKHEIQKAEVKIKAIKQANNIFRSCLQHDALKAKHQNYESSFLDDND
jgi:hypothetical protein